MSNDRSDNEHTAPSSKPSLLCYTVRVYGDGKNASWSRIGAAWAHKDGKGYEVRMDSVPVDGRLVLRAKAEPEATDPKVVAPDPNTLS